MFTIEKNDFAVLNWTMTNSYDPSTTLTDLCHRIPAVLCARHSRCAPFVTVVIFSYD
jgi:hypothetical protein